MKMDSTNPKITSPAATSMVGPMPKLARKIGVAYVATIVPTREIPMAKPTGTAPSPSTTPAAWSAARAA